MQPKKKPVAPVQSGNVVDNIKKLEQQREDRRRKMEEMKQAKLDRQAMNEAMGKNNIDAEFDMLIEAHRKKVDAPLNHLTSSQMSLCVCVRKRPLFEKEYV
jgi:kinesin family member 2/24